jgi:hypothetical protein
MPAQGEVSGAPEDPSWTYEHDLTVEDMLVHLLGKDRATLNVDWMARPELHDGMSPLEKKASTVIFDGANSSRLRVLVGFLNLQAKRKLSDVVITKIFVAIDDLIIPRNSNSKMPCTRKEARKIVSYVGLDYKIIHACPCDSTLYYGKNEKLTSCPKCRRTRYIDFHMRKNIPRKVSFSPSPSFNVMFHILICGLYLPFDHGYYQILIGSMLCFRKCFTSL